MKSPVSFVAVVLCTVVCLVPPALASAPDDTPKNETVFEKLLVVPEPASLLLLGMGLSALAVRVRARRRRT